MYLDLNEFEEIVLEKDDEVYAGNVWASIEVDAEVYEDIAEFDIRSIKIDDAELFDENDNKIKFSDLDEFDLEELGDQIEEYLKNDFYNDPDSFMERYC